MTPFLSLERLSAAEKSGHDETRPAPVGGGFAKEFLAALSTLSYEDVDEETSDKLQVVAQPFGPLSDQTSHQFLDLDATEPTTDETGDAEIDLPASADSEAVELAELSALNNAPGVEKTAARPTEPEHPTSTISSRETTVVEIDAESNQPLLISPNSSSGEVTTADQVGEAAQSEASEAAVTSRSGHMLEVDQDNATLVRSTNSSLEQQTKPEIASVEIENVASTSEAGSTEKQAAPPVEDPASVDQPERTSKSETSGAATQITAAKAQPDALIETQPRPSDVSAMSSLGATAGATSSPTLVATPPIQTAVQTPPAMTNYVAVPDDIASIISQELSSDTQNSRIRIQLDPPELGRVSLEFKFDSQGLQHVVITADSAEAIRRIRAFHPDLVATLEQHGLSGSDMTFQEKTPQQQNARNWESSNLTTPEEEMERSDAPLLNREPATRADTSATTSLDIRV